MIDDKLCLEKDMPLNISKTISPQSPHRYEFIADAQQTLQVAIKSAEACADFNLYVVWPYGYHELYNEQGEVAFQDIFGLTDDKSAESASAEWQNWTGQLPFGSKSGTESVYAIYVQASQDCTYTLKIELK